jgi:hypothetical protein
MGRLIKVYLFQILLQIRYRLNETFVLRVEKLDMLLCADHLVACARAVRITPSQYDAFLICQSTVNAY